MFENWSDNFSGNIKVFCRTRPLFEDEGPSTVEFSDDFTIRINSNDDTGSSTKRDFEFDRVYGPHVGQGKINYFHVLCFRAVFQKLLFCVISFYCNI